MPRPVGPLCPTATTELKELATALRELRGETPLREVSRLSGVSVSRVSCILAAGGATTWDTVSRIVRALDGNPDDYQILWSATSSPKRNTMDRIKKLEELFHQQGVRIEQLERTVETLTATEEAP